MILRINTNVLKESNMSIELYLFAYCVMYSDIGTWFHICHIDDDYIQIYANILIAKGYLDGTYNVDDKYNIKNLQVTEKFRIFAKLHQEQVSDINTFVEKYYNLFPSGIKSGGYYVKCDISACKAKLHKFFKKYPKFTEDDVIKATEAYIKRCKSNNYHMMKLAPYFIEKDGMSMLLAEIENMDVKEKTIQTTELM